MSAPKRRIKGKKGSLFNWIHIQERRFGIWRTVAKFGDDRDQDALAYFKTLQAFDKVNAQ